MHRDVLVGRSVADLALRCHLHIPRDSFEDSLLEQGCCLGIHAQKASCSVGLGGDSRLHRVVPEDPASQTLKFSPPKSCICGS